MRLEWPYMTHNLCELWEYRYTVNNQQKISSLNAIMSIFKKQRGDIIRPALQPSHNKRKISIKMTFNMNTWKET